MKSIQCDKNSQQFHLHTLVLQCALAMDSLSPEIFDQDTSTVRCNSWGACYNSSRAWSGQGSQRSSATKKGTFGSLARWKTRRSPWFWTLSSRNSKNTPSQSKKSMRLHHAMNDGFQRSPSVRKAFAVARTFGQLRDGLG